MPAPAYDGHLPSAAVPPAMAALQQQSPAELMTELNRVPLFMTTLDETDGAGGENVELEALKALAYEGTRVQVAANFHERGNESAREDRWLDARAFYDKALAVVRGSLPTHPAPDADDDDDPAAIELAALDKAAEEAKAKGIEAICQANRALCNLELST